MTRNRPAKLKRCLDSVYGHAKDPDSVETLIRIDDDDMETRALLDSGYFSHIKNLIVYSGPRVGYGHFFIIFQQLYPTIRGEIIICIADDIIMTQQDWDEFYYTNFHDKAVLFGKISRNGFTKKLAEKDEYIRKFANGDQPGDEQIWRYCKRNGMYEGCEPTMVHPRPLVKDKTFEEGSVLYYSGGWKLKDKSILDNLPIRRIYG